ncbi:MAG: MGH1-like glycoside hydrolase domain-containing protein, partial [Anaerolineae bacterium]
MTVLNPGDEAHQAPELLFTENDTNHERLFGSENPTPYVEDAFHAAVVHGQTNHVKPERRGTKAAAHARAVVPPGEMLEVRVRFTNEALDAPFESFEDVFDQRIAEADAFYDALHHPTLDEDARRVQRQAWAGLIWSGQFYHYSVELWLDGDPAMPKPPLERKRGRNADWRTHLYNVEVLSMPDKWEYPWFAAWDLAFHTVVQAMIDPAFCKHQLKLLLREWYQHPNGQLPAYEWDFGDVNPPVHAWAAWRVYHIDRERTGTADTVFLEQVFHKLLLNFTWWVNRKDVDDNNVFQGGFLGLDNIGVFDRSKPLPTGGRIDQADGTAWMAMYCLNMLRIALELARTKPAYDDVATKFFEHFIYISYALTHLGQDSRQEASLWDDRDGFYYDVLHMPNGNVVPLRVRSLVGLVPLFAVETLDPKLL